MSSTREKGATPPSTTPSASPKRFPGASRMLSRGRVVLDDFLAGAVPAISYHTGTIGLDHHRRHIPIGIASNGHAYLYLPKRMIQIRRSKHRRLATRQEVLLWKSCSARPVFLNRIT